MRTRRGILSGSKWVTRATSLRVISPGGVNSTESMSCLRTPRLDAEKVEVGEVSKQVETRKSSDWG